MPPRRLIVCGGAMLALSAGAAAAVAGAPPHSSLSHFVCQRAIDPLSRAVSVTAVMRPVTGTVRMAVRFDLLGKGPRGRRFAIIHGGDLGKWVSPSDPTLGQRPGDTWEPTHVVVNLAAPRLYRFRVRFRGTGDRGHLLGQSLRMSRTCYQP